MAAAATQIIVFTTANDSCSLAKTGTNEYPYTVSQGAGDPTAFAGEVGDSYTDTTNSALYFCTVRGAAGAATWVDSTN